MMDIPFPFEDATFGQGWQENRQQGADAPQPSDEAPEVGNDNRDEGSADAPQPSADAPQAEDDNGSKGSANAPQPRTDAAQVADHNEV